MNQEEIMKKIDQAEREKLNKLDLHDKLKIVIEEITYLGKIDNVDIYRLTEQDNRDNYSSVIYKYFDGDGKLRGIKNERPGGELEWIPNDADPEWDKIKDEIDKNETELEEELDQILEQLGLEKEDIENITKLDLNQEIKEKDDKDRDTDEIEKEQDKDEKETENEEEEVLGQTTDFNDYEQKIDTNESIDQKGTTIKKGLNLDYDELRFVHAYKLNQIINEKGQSESVPMKDIAVLGVKEVNGKRVVVKVPETELQYYRGSNETSVRFDDDGEVEKNTNTMERFVVPGTNKGLAFSKSEFENKVYYQSGIDRDDNTAIMGRVRDSRTGWIEAETKQIFNGNHGIYNEDRINKEMDMHKDDDKVEEENADGNLDTVTDHVHEIDANSQIIYEGQLMSVQEVAYLPRFKVSPEYFSKLYNEKAKQMQGKKEIDMDDVYNEIEDDINEQIQGRTIILVDFVRLYFTLSISKKITRYL